MSDVAAQSSGRDDLTPDLQGIDNSEIIETIGARAAPMLPASAGLR